MCISQVIANEQREKTIYFVLVIVILPYSENANLCQQ